MGIVCSGEMNERTWGKVTFLVENEVGGAFLASHSKPEMYSCPVYLWVPDAASGEIAYVLPFDSELALGTTNIGMARMVKAAVGPKARISMGEGQDEEDKCCFSTVISVKSSAGENGVVARVHKVVGGDFPSLSNIAIRYPHQKCEIGNVIEFDGDYLEPLHCGGCFTGEQGVYLQWLDADGKARGWEKVSSLVGVDLGSRFGIRDMHLFTLGPDFNEFLGYDESAEVQQFEERVRNLRRPRKVLSL